jgi:hypothetical protein
MARPNRTWGADRYWLWVCFAALFLLALPLFPDPESDSPQYLKMAYGLIGEVPKPFSGRVLVPLAARIMARISHVSVENCFALIALIAYAAIAVTVRALAGRLRIDGRLVGLAWFLPLMLFCFAHPYSPDLLAMLWVALILLAVDAGLPWVAAALFVPALLTRESLAALGLVMFVSYLMSRRFRYAAAVVVAVAGGLWLAGRLSAESAANVHEMSPLIYMVAKIPANFLGNLLGINIWTNSFQWCDAPAFTVEVPHFVSLGKIKAFGLCRPDGDEVVRGWLPYVAAFGIGTGILIALARPIAKGWRDLPEAVRLALVYGVLMFILGPMSGKSVMRTTFYGWPAFLIAGPFLFQRFLLPVLERSERILLAAFYLIGTWAAVWTITGRHLPAVLADHLPSGGFNLFALIFGLAANMAVYVIVRRRA